MAICKSATRYDSDSYYETVVDESNEDVMVRGTKNGEPVEWSFGGGGGSMMVANIRMDYASSDNVTIDKTFDELKSAIQAGVPVYARLELVQNDTVLSVSSLSTVGMQLLSQFGRNDKIIFESSGYSTEAGEITSVTCTSFTLLSDNTLTTETSVVNFTGE